MTITDATPNQREIPKTPAQVYAMVRQIGEAAAPHAARHDREASFVEEGYEAIRALGYGMIAVPSELGGGGHGLATVCRAQALLARYCANTALAIAMHQHNVLSMAWRWRLGDRIVEPVLRRIVEDELILSSSGAADPTNPGVTATPVEGGLLVTGRKRFCSGVPGADVVLTMARIDQAKEPWTTTVMVPTSDPGTEIVPDWDALGMRGSGSNPVSFSEVFVPDANIIYFEPLRSLASRRLQSGAPAGDQASADGHASADGDAGAPGAIPRIDGHRLPGLQIALTVIAAVYLGAAGGMRDRALRITAAGRNAADPDKRRIAGVMTYEMRSAWWALDALIAASRDDAIGSESHFITTMLAKRQVILASIRVVELTMELLGSRSYMRSMPFEQALRDVRAGITHPLSPEKTLYEVGRSALEYFGRQQSA